MKWEVIEFVAYVIFMAAFVIALGFAVNSVYPAYPG